MTLTEIEKEALRRAKWDAENTDSPVNKAVYRILLDYKMRREKEERQKEIDKQKDAEHRREMKILHKRIKQLYIDENLTMERTAMMLKVPLDWLSQYIFTHGLNELKKSNRVSNVGSTGTGVIQAHSFVKGM